MRTAAIVGVISAASVNADTGYGDAKASPVYASAPTAAPAYEEDTRDHFDQYWKNLELCDFEYDLSTCLLNSNTKEDFLSEELTLKCTVDSVKDFCGELTLTDKTEIENGSVHVNEKNCQTTLFANSFLVYQKIITDLNSIIGVTPSLERTTVAKTHLALQITRTNADCAINSFFHFLNQCSSASYISEKDMQCVDDYLTDSKCAFAEEAIDDWNIPALVRRYGVHGYTKVIEQMEESYQVTDETRWLNELKRIVSSGVGQGLHFIDTDYDAHTQEASITVCPQNFNSINSAFETTGIEGVEVELAAFHFPSTETVSFQGEDVVADPMYVEEKCLNTCREWFEFSKAHYEEVESGRKHAEHLKSRCFAVKGYEIFFLESGQSQSLSYEALTGVVAGTDQCYQATWKEPQSCSSHLTEWRMHLSCCTSYADYYKEQVPTPEPTTEKHGYSLLEASNNYATQAYQSYPNPQPHQQTYTQQRQQPPSNHYRYGPVVDVRKVDPADLIFDKTVVSKSGAGSLASVDARTIAERRPDLVISALDDGVATLVKECDDLEALYNVGHFGKYFKKFCDKVDFHADQIAADRMLLSADAYAPTSKITKQSKYNDYVTPIPAPAVIEFELEDYYYIGDDAAAVEICETLHIDLDFAAIVPLVSGKCFPQACVLSQLASCMEQPDAVYTYDPPMPEYTGQSGNTFYAEPYVAQPINHGYNGYHH